MRLVGRVRIGESRIVVLLRDGLVRQVERGPQSPRDPNPRSRRQEELPCGQRSS